jgi:hypothetical protein
LQEGGLRVLSRGAYDHPRVHRALRRDLQEAGDDPPICRDDYADTFGGWAHESVRKRARAFSLKKIGRKTSSRQRQALALGWKEIKEFIETAGDGLRADRERALL